MKKRILTFAALIVLLCILCMSGRGSFASIPAASSLPASNYYATLLLTDAQMNVSGIPVTYPEVQGASGDKAGQVLKKAASDFAGLYGTEITAVTYKVCYNDRGILSVLYTAQSKDGSGQRYKAVTIDAASGEYVTLASLFSEQTVWRKIVSSYVNLVIRLKGTEAYSAVSVDGRKAFCLTEKRLIIVCEPYEFTYYKNGATLFEIPYSLIADYTADGGAVDIIMSDIGD